MKNILLIDCDGTLDDKALYARIVAVIQNIWPDREATIQVFQSPGGHGLHAIVEVRGGWRISPKKIVMAQVLCGSDWKRELLNLRRIREGVKHWQVLFDTPLEKLCKK